MDVRLELPLLKCTGCGACANICPSNAITMELRQSGFGSGFRYPEVDNDKCVECGRCVRTCPVLHPDYSGAKPPEAYSVKCPEYQRECASGGVFGALAYRFVKNGGGVCGAAFDEEFNLKERYVDDVDDVFPLLKSKYIQSEPGDVYVQVEKALETGKKVLFCSTPCQVAGLKAFLKNVPDNLYCVDLLCHGVPSNEIFKRYLDKETRGKVVSAEFRSKQMGWTTSMTLVFEDGVVKRMTRKEDPFIRYFDSWAALRDSCYQCQFNRIPRQGDMTIGDHWGIGPEKRDRNGVSIVYVNTEKGKELLKMLEEDGNSVETTDFRASTVRNRAVTKPTAKPPQYPILHETIGRMRVVDSLWYAGLIKKDVCIVVMSNRNYGNNLTNWSLYRAVKNLGYSVVLVTRRGTHNISPMFRGSPYLPNETYVHEAYMLNKHCKVFMVGCDQTFAPMGILKDRFTLLPWVRGDRYMMSYSASIGKTSYEGIPDESLKEYGFYLRRFDAISVRETSTPQTMKETFGVDAECVLDPVFLTSAKEYRILSERSRPKAPEGRYLHCYLLDPTPEKIRGVREYARKMGIKKITCVLNQGDKMAIEGFRVIPAKVEYFIRLLDNCALFVTDSFHGICMSIILNKNFYALGINESRGTERVRSILDHLGLMDRWSSKAEPKFDDIDFEPVNKILEEDIARSREWLKSHLEEGMKANKQLDAFDMSIMTMDRVTNGTSPLFYGLTLNCNKDCEHSPVYDPEVCLSFARSFRDGIDTAKDPDAAIEWFKRACYSNDQNAMLELLDMYLAMDDPSVHRDIVALSR